MGKLKIWAHQEDQILIRINKTIKSKKWKRASQELKLHGFERSDVECRERYINHLDPCVNKQLWSQEELEILYSKYDQYGNKWFLLQKYLPGRTQTKIKNYFYGNIRYFLKIITKFFLKKSTGFINDIKTEVLLDMYEAKRQFEGLSIIPRSIKAMRYRVEKQQCQKLIREYESEFFQFAEHFLRKYTQKSLIKLPKSSQVKTEESYKSQRIQAEVMDIQQENGSSENSSRPIQRNNFVIISTSSESSTPQRKPFTDASHLKDLAMEHYMMFEYYQKAYLEMMMPICN